MRLFKCPSCSQMLFFENTRCERCSHRLGYDPAAFMMRSLEPEGTQDGGTWMDTAGAWRFCQNADRQACNWLLPAASAETFCLACRHNRLIPDLTVPENETAWQSLEVAKHRLLYALLRWNLPLPTRSENPVDGLVFDFPAETPLQPHVLTGHDHGVITIALKEGDAVERERMRYQMGELYRTPLGHFRHEIGHFYWDRLVRDSAYLEPFRALFGDERTDYAEALQTHYSRPPLPGWQEHFVSLYAASHPWEDFAETWAHYLHIVDTLETAAAFGLRIHPTVSRDEMLQADIDFDPYAETVLDKIVDDWLPLAFAINSLNRSMGQADVYPFVLSPKVMEKLGYIHALVHGLAVTPIQA
jgi:hypothetical protein